MKRVKLDFIAIRAGGVGLGEPQYSELHLVAKVSGDCMLIVPDANLFRFGFIENFDIIKCEEKPSSDCLSCEEIFDVKLKDKHLTVQLKVLSIITGWKIIYMPKI